MDNVLQMADHSPHIRALLAAARAEGRAEGRREEREATLGYLWRSDHPRLHAAAGQIEANQHVDLDGQTLFTVTLDNAHLAGEAAGYRRAIDDACGLLDEPHRSTVRALAPDTDGTP